VTCSKLNSEPERGWLLAVLHSQEFAVQSDAVDSSFALLGVPRR